MGYLAEAIKPVKYDWNNKWTVTADLRGLETFTNSEKYSSNYDIVDKLKEDGILKENADEDSEYCQFFAYFKTKQGADAFIKRLSNYVAKRKRLMNSL